MSELGSNERRLLHALRETEGPSVEDRARVRARVIARVVAAGGAATTVATKAAATSSITAGGAASVASGAGAAWATGAAWKIASVLVIAAGAAGGTAYVAVGGRDAEPPTRAPAQAVASAVEIERPRVRGPEVESTPPARSTSSSTRTVAPRARQARKPSPPSPKAPAPVQLDEELVLLEHAQQALERGDVKDALASLNEHADEHPNGALASERQGIVAVALCQSGRTTEGQRAARRFLTHHPKSPLAARVRAACLSPRK